MRRLPVVLLAVAALLAGFGAWFTVEAHQLRSSESARNRALVDAEATAEVSAAVTSALNKVFSYSFDSTGDTERAAKDLLRDEARQAYDRLFERVRQRAPEQRLTVTTHVVGTAVRSLTDEQAQVLAFLDQTATRANGKPSTAAAQLLVTARREGKDWLITNLQAR